MYHIVPEVRFSIHIIALGLPRCHEVGFIQLLYIISTAVRSGLPDSLLHWFCHGVMRLVSSNGYIYYFHDREVGFTDGSSLLLLPRHLSMLGVVRWGVPRFIKDIWYGTLLVSE